MTLGVGSYSPSPRFAFPRSYIRGIAVNVTANDVALTDNIVTFSDPSNPNVTFQFRIWSHVYAWTTNRYTLDFVIDESFYKVAPSPTENPMPFSLTYYQPEPGMTYLAFQPFGIIFPDTHFFDLPTNITNYWLPLPWHPSNPG
jgi:hypothetical protein